MSGPQQRVVQAQQAKPAHCQQVSGLIANSLCATGSAGPADPANSHRDHHDPPVILRLTLAPARVLAEVWDSSEEPRAPAAAAGLDEAGRGLMLVSACFSAWHWYPATGGKATWAAFDLPGPARWARTDPRASPPASLHSGPGSR